MLSPVPIRVEDLVGKVVTMSKDQNGCRLLQQKLDDGHARLRELIYQEVGESVPRFASETLPVCTGRGCRRVIVVSTRTHSFTPPVTLPSLCLHVLLSAVVVVVSSRAVSPPPRRPDGRPVRELPLPEAAGAV